MLASRTSVPVRCSRPLGAGAVDTVGGSTLSYLLRTTNLAGNIALCGLVGGPNFNGTVIPFCSAGTTYWALTR